MFSSHVDRTNALGEGVMNTILEIIRKRVESVQLTLALSVASRSS
jgi:hypothetical protein